MDVIFIYEAYISSRSYDLQYVYNSRHVYVKVIIFDILHAHVYTCALGRFEHSVAPALPLFIRATLKLVELSLRLVLGFAVLLGAVI